MMTVQKKIALCLHSQVKKPVPCEAVKHMVKKTDPGVDLIIPCPVKIDGD